MSLRFKRHKYLLLLFVLVIALLVVVLGDRRIFAYTVRGSGTAAEPVTNYDNPIDLFDDTAVHQVVVLISEEDQAQMLTTYQQTGAKEYFSADIIIDGVRINNVGLRLKGNASLRSAAGGGMMGGREMGGGRGARPEGEAPVQPERRQRPEGMAPPGDFQLPEGVQPPADFQMPEGFQPPEGFELPQAWQGRDGFNRPDLAGGTNENLPYLVKLDAFVPGQRYQGLAEIALRTAGAFADPSLLQEPVSNYVMNRVGVPIARSAYASVQVSGGEPQLYTIAEHIDQIYLDRLFPGSDGVLYKVTQVGNAFNYLGEDPTAYANVFDQETAKNQADLAPLIDLIRFVNQATDEEFAQELPDRLDVVAFADYLAIHNLLVNNDSLAGMGNNYYLYYDFDRQRFTILSWDMNESLGKMAMGRGSQMDIYWGGVGDMFGRGFGGEATGRGRHRLMERFLATAGFRELYKERYRALYQQVYGDDLLTPKIDQFVALVTAYNAEHALVDQAAFDAAAADVRQVVAGRQEYLSSLELLSAGSGD